MPSCQKMMTFVVLSSLLVSCSEAKPLEPVHPSITSEAVVGSWICPLFTGYEFDAHGRFRTIPQGKTTGSWSLDRNRLSVATKSGAIHFVIREITVTKMELETIEYTEKPTDLCWASSGGEAYASLVHDKKITGDRRQALVGTWGESEGLELHKDGSFTYHGPECPGGRWMLAKDQLHLNYRNCDDETYEIAWLSSYQLGLRPMGGGKVWSLLRSSFHQRQVATRLLEAPAPP